MTRFFGLLVVFFLVVLARMWSPDVAGVLDADATLALGFVLLVSFIIGQAVAAWGIPAITGYIITGLVFGPYVLAILTPELAVLNKQTVESLQLLDGVALGLIALTAGGELRISAIRRRARSISWVTLCHMFMIFVSVTAMVLLARPWFGMLSRLGSGQMVVAAMLFGITAVANSPATTIAVIQECGSRGPVTDVALAVTIVKDIVVLTAFTIVLAASVLLVQPAQDIDARVLFKLFWEVSGSLVLGLGLGWLMTLYLKYVNRELPLVALGVALVSVAVSEEIHVSGLLVCAVAGFYVQNFSDHGEDLIGAVERHSLPIYIVFFTIAGAGLDMVALRATWSLALILMVSRLLFTFLATYAGARIAGDVDAVRKYAWTGFIGQAGVTLGFAVIIADRFPDIGPFIKTVVVAVIGINQIVGPVIFRVGLNRAGEVPQSAGQTSVDALKRPEG